MITYERSEMRTQAERGMCMYNVFDHGVLGERASLYQAQVVPALFPEERPMRVDNWNPEDLEAYCGGEYVRRAS